MVDSPVFYPGKAIECLFTYGIDQDKRIKNAIGHFSVLRNLSEDKIIRFLLQVELINCINEKEIDILNQKINSLDKNKKHIDPEHISINFL